MAQTPTCDAELVTLLAAVSAGDRRALKALYDATSVRLFGVAQTIVRRREAAEDVLQEAYVRVWLQARSYDPERGAALPWLSRIVRNLAVDHLRRERSKSEPIDDHADSLAEPDQPVGERLDLSRALARLSAEQRHLLTLAFVDGYTHVELVARLGLPLGTAKSRLRRGLAEMRAQLVGQRTAFA
jgi:RNA polymerase sigma-70 factor (ECF subfamily)